MTVSRRTMLGAGALALGSLLAGCVRAGGRGATTQPTTASSVPIAQSTSSPVVPSSVGVEAPSSSGSRPTRPGPAREYAYGRRDRNQVALTFHGAGDPVLARRLLAIFDGHRTKVTVLAVGTWLTDYPEMAQLIVAAGHELGNHTYTHPDIDSLTSAAAHEEIVKCRDLLVRLVGSGGRFFRPSQAQHATSLVRRLAGAAGYPVCLSYDTDSLDYTDPGSAAVRQNVTAARAGSIVSMHFGHADTVTAMPGVLRDLRSRGLRAVTASTLLAP